ncbi:MAG: family NAD(P)-dependent oxidoreductase, partial [Nevskia sp.]|nr:family NAD(P)-dependent oxidoreductase [Nevskia sp.]
MLSAEDFLKLSAVRGRCMAEAAGSSAPGAMAAVQARREIVAAAIEGLAGVKIANHNAPDQAVISGPAAAVEEAAKKLEASSVRVSRLPVSGAFHTELVASAQQGLSAAIHDSRFNEQRCAVYSNTSGARYPNDIEGMRRTLDGHLLNSVEFVAEIEAMYAAGARVFIELGPKGICSNMAKATLAGRDAIAVSLDGQGGGLRGLLTGLAELYVAGVPLALSRLFDNRDPQTLDLSRLAELVKPVVLPKHAWWISGGCARPLDDPMFRTGKLPALDLAGVDAAREKARSLPAPIVIAPMVPATIPVASSPAAPTVSSASTSMAPAMPAMNGTISSDALVAYQQTMRQFLSLQERVIQQFLGAPGSTASTVAAAPAIPQPLQQRPAAPAISAAPASPVTPAAVAKPAVTTAAPPAVAVTAPVARAAFDATSVLLEIVAERTGYPAEMLGLDQDLEAELGIDSIKRVEILGAFQKRLPATVAESMQSGMERYTRAKTLHAILDTAQADLAALAGSAGAAAVTAVVAVPAVAVAALDRTSLTALLLGIVAERTGYPAEMLGLDQDLEAELGIDSIKRVEILGALQKTLSPAQAEAMQAGMESFTRARSLNAILDAAIALAPLGVAASAAPVATTAVPAVTAVALDRASVQTQLLSLVAERTGYPTDMLGLDQDLEAELGIDSIKRVEILGALQKTLSPAQADAMQAGMEKFTRARSLNAILDEVMVLAPGIAAVSSMPLPSASVVAAPVAAKLDRAAIQVQLLSLVAERTGYPTEMLGLDQDLEAELGIDSIKRVEILGALQKTLPAADAEAMQTGMEQFTRARSLNAILDAVMALAPISTAVAAVPLESIVTPAATAASEAAATIPRYVPRPRVVPLSTQREPMIAGVYLLTADSLGVAERLADRIVGAGSKAIVIPAETTVDPQAIGALIERVREAHGRIAGIVHLAPLATAATEDVDGWRLQTALQAKALFWLLQKAGNDLSSAQRAVALSASRFGGSLGREASGSSSAPAGAAVGIFNCAVAEWPNLRARLVDFEDSASADFIADALFDELAAIETRTEIGYRGSERIGFTHVLENISDTPFAPHLQPAGDWVVLVTGGARGITAEIAEELARPGQRLVLLGRTPLPTAESADTASITEAPALKKKLLELALAAGRKPTPAELERELRSLGADREIRANLARLTATGAAVDYRACDVRDAQAFGTLLDLLYADYGRIDAVIHGAGVIEDKRIADKTPDSFDRVYDTKVDSAYVMQQKLRPEGLKLLAFFTSVAGRFGNVGQSDYGAANETLNRLAWQLHREWPGVRVLSINWGPWDAGMATDAIRAGFRSRGVEPIPVPAGRRFLLDEMAFGPRNDVELVAGQGPWTQAPTAPEQAAPAGASIPEAAEPSTEFPFVRRPPRIGVGGAVTLEHRLSLDADPYLIDHCMDGKPVLPAAAGLEYMAQFVAAGWPEWQVAEMLDVRALSGIVFEGNGHRDLILRARSSTHSEAGQQAVTVEIIDPSRKAANYRATAVLMPRLPEAPIADNDLLAGAERMEASRAYSEFLFH